MNGRNRNFLYSRGALRRRAAFVLPGLCCVLFALFARAEGAEEVRFNRDIRPLLGENCLACHGPDPAAREAGLRLDTREGLFEPLEDGKPAVIPGDPEGSKLWYRISTGDELDRMPPADSRKELSSEQIALIKTWIEQGAPWEDHWAFIAPERPEVPKIEASGVTIRNEIDAFVVEELEKRGLRMNSEADRRTLARRLALDLTGLPPTPAQVDAFEGDDSPDYFERFVDALMETSAWGEHRARYWLDAARYADTHGLHFDNYREMWPYRDWVIGAFNGNMPFDRFTIEQLAGDLLEDPTDDQLVATGFQRCKFTTNEGGTIEEENLSLYASDRVTTLGWVFQGLTTNCSACHDHKFDPMTQ
jgi:mono/diheme cytochrome c family protein